MDTPDDYNQISLSLAHNYEKKEPLSVDDDSEENF